MPHCKLEEIPSGATRWPTVGNKYLCVHWGDMEVALTQLPDGLDATNNYVDGGLPGGVCPCPHYGYVFEGTMRARYPGTDWPEEVVGPGEVYFIPAGHVLSYDGPCKVLEFNPAHALQTVMDGMQRAADKRVMASRKE